MGIKNTSKAKKLGDLLVEVGLISPEQLKQAAALQRTRGGTLGDSLVELKALSREVLLSFLGKRCGVSYVDLSEVGPIPADALALIPEGVARKEALLPLRRKGRELTVAMSDPLNVFTTDDLRALTGCEIQVVIASEEEIRAAIDAAYGDDCPVPSVEGQVRFPTEADRETGLVRALLDNAVRAGASAVHLEPQGDGLKVHYRVQGWLASRPEICGKSREGLTARIKSLAGMSTQAREGRIRAKLHGREVDILVSTMRAGGGERIVMRFPEPTAP